MSKRDHVQVGKATNLHYGSGKGHHVHASHTGAGHRSGQASGASHIIYANNASRRFSATERAARAEALKARMNRPRRPPNMKALAVVLACVVVIAAVGGWYFCLRSVTVTVNGTEVSVRVGTPLSTVLEDNDQFGAVPGRLLSVGGNVLSQDGGNSSTVSRAGETLTPDEVEQARVQEGDEFTVSNGTDAEEPSKEETVTMAPGIQKESGGAVQYVSQWGKAGKKRVKTGETSGETVDVEVLEEPQDMVVSSVNLSPEGGKYVALTFDDGPSKYTPQILEILEEKDAKATFSIWERRRRAIRLAPRLSLTQAKS